MLNKGDKIIVDTEDIKLLRFLNKTIVNQKLEFKPMFLNKGEEFLKEIINNEIYGLIPMNGEFLKGRFEV